MCGKFVYVKLLYVKFVCVKLLYVKFLCVGGGGRREEKAKEEEKEPGIQNQKQEPHTKMWGKKRKRCGWELWVYSIACGFNTRIGGLDSQKRRKNDEKDDTSTTGTCVVADRAEAIDGQAAAQGGQHAQGRQRHAVEIAELERHKNGLSSLAAWQLSPTIAQWEKVLGHFSQTPPAKTIQKH